MEDNNVYAQDSLTKPMSFGDWIKTLLLLIIPVANIILLFVWAFGDRANINKKNFSRAYLLLVAIVIILYIIIFVIFAGLMYIPSMY